MSKNMRINMPKGLKETARIKKGNKSNDMGVINVMILFANNLLHRDLASRLGFALRYRAQQSGDIWADKSARHAPVRKTCPVIHAPRGKQSLDHI